MYLPLRKVAETPFHIQGDGISAVMTHIEYNCNVCSMSSIFYSSLALHCITNSSHDVHIISQPNNIHSPNPGLMLAHRLQRRPNINPALVERLVFNGLYPYFMKVSMF